MSSSLTELERLVVTDEVRQLMGRYAYHLDHKEFAEFSEIFAPTATMTVLDVKGVPVVEMKGLEQIEKIISNGIGRSSTIHHLFSFVVDVHSVTSASMIVAMEDRVDPPEGDTPDAPLEEGRPHRSVHGYGHYHCEFEKIDETWKITKILETRARVDVSM